MIYLIFEVLLLLILTKLKYKKFFTLGSMFGLAWSVPLIVDLIAADYMGILKPSNTIIWYVGLGILAYNLVYFVMVHKNEAYFKFEFSDYGDKSIIYLLLIMSAIILLPSLINNYQNIANGNFGAIRTYYVQQIQTAGGIKNYVTMILPYSIINCAMMISAVDVINNGKYKLFITTFLLMLMYTGAYGGREQYKVIIIYFFILIVANRGKKEKNTGIVYVMIVMIVGLIISITMQRGGSDSSFLKMFAEYFVSQYSMLQYIINHPDVYGLFNPNCYGLLSLGPIWTLPGIVLKMLIHDISLPADMIGEFTQQYVNISTTSRYLGMNAHTTSIYYFLFDFGKWGVIFGPMIFGFLSAILQKYKKFGGKYRGLFELFLINVILNSSIVYDLCQPDVAIMIPVFMLMSLRIKVRFVRRNKR